MSTIEELHEAAGRLHACAWHGRKSVGEGSRARFSVPRQPGDDDEILYAAIEELRRLGPLVDACQLYAQDMVRVKAGELPYVQECVAETLLGRALEVGEATLFTRPAQGGSDGDG